MTRTIGGRIQGARRLHETRQARRARIGDTTMHDSYTRHACGIRTFTATRASRAVDALLLIAGWAVALAPIATFIF